MFKKTIAASLLLITTLSGAQQIAKTSYGEVGITNLSIKSDNLDRTFSPTLVKFAVGTEINQNLDVEGFYATTIKKDSYSETYNGNSVDIGIKASSYGVYLKPKTKIANDLELFAKLGYATSKLEASASAAQGSASDSDTESSFSYGIGLKKYITKDVFGVIDYSNYYKKDGVSANGLTFTIGASF